MRVRTLTIEAVSRGLLAAPAVTRMVEKLYGHLAPSFIADAIRGRRAAL